MEKDPKKNDGIEGIIESYLKSLSGGRKKEITLEMPLTDFFPVEDIGVMLTNNILGVLQDDLFLGEYNIRIGILFFEKLHFPTSEMKEKFISQCTEIAISELTVGDIVHRVRVIKELSDARKAILKRNEQAQTEFKKAA